MKIQVLGCCQGKLPGYYTTAFLLNDHFLLDAGEIGELLRIEEQYNITDVLLTHAHLDHIAGLPFLGDIIFGRNQRSISIISIPEVIEALHQHVFNNQIWPDFTQLPAEGPPIFRLHSIPPEKNCSIGEFEVIPFPVCHTVPTVGYLVRENDKALLYSGDTGNIQQLIKIINRTKHIRAALIEISFPNRLKKLAEQTGHLIPASINKLLSEINRSIPLWLFHMKPQYIKEITEECREVQGQVRILRQGETLYLP